MEHKGSISYKLKAISSLSGFTLVELVVVVGISIIVTATMLLGYKRVGSVGAMERAASRVAQDIRLAQSYALTVDPTKFGGLPPCGFGMHAPDPKSSNVNSYIIYAKIPSTTSVPCGVISRQWVSSKECFDISISPPIAISCPATPIHFVSTSTVKSFVLTEGEKVSFDPSVTIFDDVYFEPPEPKTSIMHVGVGVSSTVSFTEFLLRFSDNTAITRRVRVENTGRVGIVGGQLLSKPCVAFVCSNVVPGGAQCGSWLDGCGNTLSCGIGGACVTPGDACCLAGPCGTASTGQCYPTPPAAPTSLAANSVSMSQIDLTWIDNAVNEANFEIVRMLADCATVITTFTISGNGVVTGPFPVSPHQDTGLTANTTYCYKVRATNVTGPSGYTANVSVATRPLAPSILVVGNGGWSYSMMLTWVDNCGSCTVRVERCSGSGCIPGTAIASGGPGSPYCDNNTGGSWGCIPAPSASDPPGTNVYPKTLYRYRVISVGAGGDSLPSNTAENTTADVKPTVPTGLTLMAQSTSRIDVHWIDDQDLGYGEETQFTLYRCTGSACNPQSDPTTVSVPFPLAAGNNPAGAVSYPSPDHQDQPLTPATDYTYCVTASNSAGTSACSAWQTTKTFFSVPTNLTATSVSTSQINLTWTDNAIGEGGYSIERGDAACTPASFGQIGTTGAFSGTGTYSDTMGLVAETTYCYRVRAALSGTPQSGYSNTATAITWLPTPGSFTVTALSGSQVKLTWIATPPNTETGFKIEKCSGSSGCTPLQFTVTLANVASYLDSGLAQSTLHCYQIRSTSLPVDSAYTAKVCVTTPIQGYFTETGGFVVFEAEEYLTFIDRSGKSWLPKQTAQAGYSGTGYMEALPNSGTALPPDATSPELQYQITFNTTGTYYVWVLGAGPGNGDREVHAGLDGAAPNSDCIRNFGAAWSWQSGRKSGCVGANLIATVSVGSAGAHTFNLWMREDGFRADRILLTNDSTYTPNPPVVTLTAAPTSVSSGGSSTLTWSITNASLKTCTASASPANTQWSGAKATSGSQIITGIAATTTFTLTCTGLVGETGSGSATVTLPPPFDFSLANSGNRIISQGSQGSNTVTTTLTSGTTQPVSFSVSGLPAGAVPSFSLGSCNPTCSTILTITNALTTPLGAYVITVTGTTGALTYSTTFNLDVTAAPIGYWKLDESVGATNFADSSPNANTGSCTAPSCPTAGVVGHLGNSADFDGTNDYILVGNNASLNTGGNVTISAWFNSRNPSAGLQNIMSKGGDTTRQYYLRVVNATSLRFCVNTGTLICITLTTPAMSANTWYHAAGTYDGTTLSLYFNGAPVGSGAGSGPIASTAQDFAIGAVKETTGATSQYFNGLLDEVRIYDRVLSGTEIANLP